MNAVPEELFVDAAAHDGRGIARDGGKVVFIEQALPGERVQVLRRRRRRHHDEAALIKVIEPSPGRVEPRCLHFGVCGGCALQHAASDLQLEIKQQALADSLARIARTAPVEWLAPVTGPTWRYRRRARLSCRYVESKGRTLVGFRERGRPFVADLSDCETLADPAGGLIEPLAALIGGLDQARRIPQVEVTVADNVTILVLRHLEPLGSDDRDKLRAFAAHHGVEFHLQPGGSRTIAPLDPPGTTPVYRLDAHDIDFAFAPADFIQVNADVNRAMVDKAMELLAPERGDAVLDLFCGLGNFTLPLARHAGRVTGVEGDAGLVARARGNATRNGISACEFHAADLAAPPADASWMQRRYDRLLLDPPRAGAREAVAQVGRWAPARILYVSCHPGTLARDTGDLVHVHGYRLVAAGVVDMFPHTAHVESIALFERG